MPWEGEKPPQSSLRGPSRGRHRGGNRLLHQLNDGHLSRITLALAKLHNARVTTGSVLEDRRNLVEKDMNQVVLLAPLLTDNLALAGRRPAEKRTWLGPQLRRGLTPKMDVLLFGSPDRMATEGDELLHNLPNDLRLRHGGGNSLVLDDVRSQVREHRIAVLAAPTELRVALQVSHDAGKLELVGRLGLRFKEAGLKGHA